jgi:uncharacterized protein
MKRNCSLLTFCCLLVLSVLLVWEPQANVAALHSQQAQRVETKIDPKLFDEFVGQYQFLDDRELVLSFLREGDRFFVQPTGQSKIEIFPQSPVKFFLKISPVEITFQRDSQGKVTQVIWYQNDEDRPAIRISDKPAVEVFVPFQKREVMIPMRDGVKLHTVVFSPSNQSEALPILLNRTPYGADGPTMEWLNRRHKDFVQDGYIFVFQDIRGRYESEGDFMMDRPLRDKTNPKSIDESTDTFDTIDWLIKNIDKNNGRLGILGVSYDGWLAAVATVDAHPALKASSPQAPMTDAYLGDDFFHNGAFRQSYGFEYVKSMESSKEGTDVSFDKDAYDWYLGFRTMSRLGEQLGGKLPTWNAFVSHPNYDEYWQARGAANYLKQTTVPTLVVGGWWDQEDFYGTLKAYEALEKFDRDNKNFLVLGPWNHGGWNGRGRVLGKIKFGSTTGIYFRREIQAPWFAYYLKGRGKQNQPEALTFQTGCNHWVSYSKWPPKEADERALYLRSGRKLSFEKARGQDEQAYESYDSDPANPVPYRKRPVEATYDPAGSGWSTWLVQDQRFLNGRADVISWQSEVLTEDLTVSGEVIAYLFAMTSGTDSDWVVKLIDVYPESYPEDAKMSGYQLMVANEIFRGRFRESFQRPLPIPSGVNEYQFSLNSLNHCFKKGHRVMVQVQSSWFPLYDRNPQKFVQNIFKAAESDYQLANQRIYESSRYPSRLNLPVLSH